MRVRSFLFIVLTVAVFLGVPLTAGAAPVAWSTEEYYVYTIAKFYASVEDEDYGPPLPVTAMVDEYEFTNREYGYSEVTASSLFVDAISSGVRSHADALARFQGTFTATNPFFLLSYTYTPFI